VTQGRGGPGISRRELLGAGGGALLAAAAPGTAASAPDQRAPVNRDSGESRALAAYIAETPYDALTPKAVKMAKRSILDAIGVSMGAAGVEPVCRPFLAMAANAGGDDAAVIGTGRRAGPAAAALANGALAHALDYEDAHGGSFTHPNAAAVAAAVAVCEVEPGTSGKDFIAAVALGCDLVVRLALARGDLGKPPRAFYPPAIVGTFGAVAAASRLLQLDRAQVLDAFSLALNMNSFSAQILYSPYSDIRAIRDAFSAQAGVQAALLARDGIKGFDAPFEGKGGFFDMVADGRAVPGVLTDSLGDAFAGEDVGFKAWPACRASHIYIQAALEGAGGRQFVPGDIDRIDAVVKESDLIICEPAEQKRRPRAAIDAKFSLYFIVATALARGEVTLGSFATGSLADEQVLALADKVHYTLDERRARPREAGGGDLLTVRFRDGSVGRWGIDALYGSPENPMSEQALVEKFVDCGRAAPRRPDGAALRAVARAILALDTIGDVRDVSRKI